MPSKFSSPLVNPVHVVSYENVGQFGKLPRQFAKLSYKFSSPLVRRRPMGNSYENVGRFGKSPRRTIYQIVLQIFILAYSVAVNSLIGVGKIS